MGDLKDDCEVEEKHPGFTKRLQPRSRRLTTSLHEETQRKPALLCPLPGSYTPMGHAIYCLILLYCNSHHW